MGYILPIPSYEIKQYVVRLQEKPNHFAHIDKVAKAQWKSAFDEVFEQQSKQFNGKKEPNNRQPKPSKHDFDQSFVYPNPDHLSPIIAKIIGKGMHINDYA